MAGEVLSKGVTSAWLLGGESLWWNRRPAGVHRGAHMPMVKAEKSLLQQGLLVAVEMRGEMHTASLILA